MAAAARTEREALRHRDLLQHALQRHPHRAIHHSPDHMSRWNTSVSLPWSDCLRGTFWHGEAPAGAEAA